MRPSGVTVCSPPFFNQQFRVPVLPGNKEQEVPVLS
jgi:hypothetical protein